jgi:hypothetical protein
MKRFSLVSATCIMALLLAGCGSAATGSSRFRGGLRTLTPEARLAIGTMNLEGTPQAVDATLAARLLPLWQLLEQLNTSSTTAPQEIQAVVDEIQATMSPDQMAAIQSMNITPADAFSGFQQGGQGGSGSNAAGQAGGQRSSDGGNSTRRNGGGGGGFFFSGGPGGFPGGGFAGNNNRTGSTQSQNGSTQASQQQAANAVSGFLVTRVIRLLEGKIGG